MAAKIITNLGEVHITNEAIAHIAGAAAYECYGIIGMSTRSVTEGIAELLKRENLQKGIKVTADGEYATIDMHVVVEYGIRISTTAENIIRTVKYTVENLTGLHVEKVNVFIEGIRVEK